MNRAIINFDPRILDTIHTYSLELLQNTGIRFPNKKALKIFKTHGLRVDGDMVFFTENEIEKAITTAPPAFTVNARDSAKSIQVGGNGFVMAPGYGPPFIIELSGKKRNATVADVQNFCKLVQTSKVLDFNSSMVVQPGDVPSETAHLDILLATLCLTDKPVMGSSVSEAAAIDSLALSKMIWGHTNEPVMISLVNSLSPMQYATEMVDAIMIFAGAGQPLIIHSSCILGTTGPITMAGSLVISNATTLAGICLAQLIHPGVPIVYGFSGSPTEMKTGGFVTGSPEDTQHTAIAAAMGRFYHLPCRSQGALTESFCLDYQAGMESAMMMTSAALSGVHLVLHACGTYGSIIAMGYEKFIADEDLCSALKKLIKPVEFTNDAFAMDLIKEVGTMGNYLVEDHTALRCRDEFFIPDLSMRATYEKWVGMEDRDMAQRAGKIVDKRLAYYEKPPLDPAIEKDMVRYVENRKHKK